MAQPTRKSLLVILALLFLCGAAVRLLSLEQATPAAGGESKGRSVGPATPGGDAPEFLDRSRGPDRSSAGAERAAGPSGEGAGPGTGSPTVGESRWVTGRVLDQDSSAPVQGVEVSMANCDAWCEGNLEGLEAAGELHSRRVTAKTDETGRFVLRGVLPGHVAWSAQGESHVRLEGREDLRFGQEGWDLGDIYLTGGLRLCGRIVDANNAPIEGALVLRALQRPSDPFSVAYFEPLEIARSTRSGEFRTLPVDPDRVVLSVAAEGHDREILDLEERLVVDDLGTIVLGTSLEIAGFAIPVPRSPLAFEVRPSQRQAEAFAKNGFDAGIQGVVRADGEFIARGIPSSLAGERLYVRIANAEHMEFGTAHLVAGSTGNRIDCIVPHLVEFSLAPSNAIGSSGTSNRALPPPSVTLIRYHERSPRRTRELRVHRVAGKERTYEVEVPPSKTDAVGVQVVVRSRYQAEYVSEYFVPQLGGRTALGQLSGPVLESRGIRVLDGHSGRPLARAEVQVHHLGEGAVQRVAPLELAGHSGYLITRAPRLRTNEAGEVTVTADPSAVPRLFVTRGGYAPRLVELTGGGSSAQAVELTSGAQVVLHVTHGGAPVTGVKVELRPEVDASRAHLFSLTPSTIVRHGRTDAEGLCSLRFLPGGVVYRVLVGGQPTNSDEPLVPKDGEAVDVHVDLGTKKQR